MITWDFPLIYCEVWMLTEDRTDEVPLAYVEENDIAVNAGSRYGKRRFGIGDCGEKESGVTRSGGAGGRGSQEGVGTH
jgi:hypothetical protein